MCDGDDDNDRLSDADEQYIFAYPSFAGQQLVPCHSSPPTHGQPTPCPRRPVSRTGPLDTGDVLLVQSHVGPAPGDTGYWTRYDLSADAGNVIDTSEVLLILGFAGTPCSQPQTNLGEAVS